MTSSSVQTNSHLSRRASIAATAPYTIPTKSVSPTKTTGHTPSHKDHHHHHTHHKDHRDHRDHREQHRELSSSVPLLSREFVVRRISEGETGRLKEELKCEACGKGYKHISSLAKHLWEHTPEWNVTKKLLISKHQQVQLLEAASILVSMNDGKDGGEVKFNPKYRDVSPQLMSQSLDSADSTPVKRSLNNSKSARMNSISNNDQTSMQLPQLTEMKSPKLSPRFGVLDVPRETDDQDEEDDGVFGNMD